MDVEVIMPKKNKSLKKIFNKVYNKSRWGNEDGNSTSGRGSHSSEFFIPYCEQMTDFLNKFTNPKILDLGCGDFNIGKRLIRENHNWFAYDISDVIVSRNKETYDRSNLTFECLDFCDVILPDADIAFVRQVFQHLENKKIAKFIDNLNAKKNIEYLIVTEHNPVGKFIPNIDKVSDCNIRLKSNSGVVLDASPFNLKFTVKEDVLKIRSGDSVVQTTIYKIN